MLLVRSPLSLLACLRLGIAVPSNGGWLTSSRFTHNTHTHTHEHKHECSCQKCERLYDSTSTIYQVNEAAPQYTLCGNGACVIPCESSVRRNRGRDRELGPPSRDEYAFGMNAYGDAGEYSTKDACAAGE